jgi:hypothetical protein
VEKHFIASAGPAGFGAANIDLNHFIMATSNYLKHQTVDEGRLQNYKMIMAQNRSDRASLTSADCVESITRQVAGERNGIVSG